MSKDTYNDIAVLMTSGMQSIQKGDYQWHLNVLIAVTPDQCNNVGVFNMISKLNIMIKLRNYSYRG